MQSLPASQQRHAQQLSRWLRQTATPQLLAELAAEAAAQTLPALQPHQAPPPGAWRGWLFLAGRGAGKTFAGARQTVEAAERVGYLRAIGPTYADARDVCVEGESGILRMARARVGTWNRSLGELVFTNGARLKLFSADEPDRLRGPQSAWDWYDELAAWRYPETLDMALMGLRLGDDPRWMATTTPRPTALVRRLLSDPTVAVTRATTFDNTHLPDAFKAVILARYDGTRQGRQELHAELLEDTPGALWTLAGLDALRVREAPPLARVVVGVDPKSGDTGEGGETGIVIDALGSDGHGYTLADRSTDGGPGIWAPAVVKAVRDFEADAVVVEKNQGGAMVAHTLRNTPGGERLRIVEVWASRGKVARAEPVAALYERGMWHHVGAFPQLETQMTTYVPGSASPDRLDAHVHAATELFPGLFSVSIPTTPAPKHNPWNDL